MYDPILCMNVPDSVKTKDYDDTKLDTLYRLIKNSKEEVKRSEELNAKGMGNKQSLEVKRKMLNLLIKEYKDKGGKRNVDFKSIDKAIRICMVDKNIEFPSEKEAIEYCKENGLDPHKIILMGDKYIVRE